MKKVYEEIINSLTIHPEDWWLGSSYLNHKSGVRIGWIWNEKNPINMGDVFIESTEEPKIYRYFNKNEKEDFDLLWKKVLDCKSAESLKDQIIINFIKM